MGVVSFRGRICCMFTAETPVASAVTLERALRDIFGNGVDVHAVYLDAPGMQPQGEPAFWPADAAGVRPSADYFEGLSFDRCRPLHCPHPGISHPILVVSKKQTPPATVITLLTPLTCPLQPFALSTRPSGLPTPQFNSCRGWGSQTSSTGSRAPSYQPSTRPNSRTSSSQPSAPAR